MYKFDTALGTVVVVEQRRGESIMDATERTLKEMRKDSEAERYARQSDTAEFAPKCENVRNEQECAQTFSFSVALSRLKRGCKVARKGWNGKGIFIELQRSDAYSKMTSPYIFIDTTGLRTDNPDAPKSRVPWLASQTDMLAEDWVIVE